MKTWVTTIQREGKDVQILKVSAVEPTAVATLEKKAKENAEAFQKADSEALRLESERKARELEEAKKEAYFASWRVVFACDSLLNDWQLGDDGIDQEKVSKCKASSLKGESAEKLLEIYDDVKERFIAIFGGRK